MPGVYAKILSGERFEKLKVLVERCSEIVHAKKNYNLIHENIALIMVLTASKSQAVIEELCYAGGLSLIFEIINLRVADDSFGDIRVMLDYVVSLMALEIDPYDDSTGVLPMLVYFLTERHTHYVDIAWNSKDLKYMTQFLHAYTNLIRTYPKNKVPTEDCKVAIKTLADVLRVFPAHRVYADAANVFSSDCCTSFVSVLQKNQELWDSFDANKTLLQCLIGIASFGMGYLLAFEAPSNQLLITLFSQLIYELRCPCLRCEHLRRYQHVMRDRDEFGILQASEPKQLVPRALIFGNVAQLIENIFTRICDHRSSKNVENKENLLNSSDDLDVKVDHREDELTQLAVVLVWILSEANNEMYESSILASNDYALLTALLKSIDLSDFRYWFDVNKFECLHGSRLIIECICGLLLRAEKDEQQIIYNMSKFTLEIILEKIASAFTEKIKDNYRAWKPHYSSLLELQTALLAAVYIGSKPSSNCSLKSRKSALQTPLRPSCYDYCIQMTNIMYEGYQWVGKTDGGTNEIVFITTLLVCMGILVNGYEYSRCKSERKTFFPPPNVNCAFMASAARDLISTFKTKLSNGESCIIITKIGSLVISRAEKASSLLSV